MVTSGLHGYGLTWVRVGQGTSWLETLAYPSTNWAAKKIIYMNRVQIYVMKKRSFSLYIVHQKEVCHTIEVHFILIPYFHLPSVSLTWYDLILLSQRLNLYSFMPYIFACPPVYFQKSKNHPAGLLKDSTLNHQKKKWNKLKFSYFINFILYHLFFFFFTFNAMININFPYAWTLVKSNQK